MADKPIIFSAPMVRALLDGRKTQTRRAARLPANPRAYLGVIGTGDHVFTATETWGGQWRSPYAPGDRLYVRESWQSNGLNWGKRPRDMCQWRGPVHYMATDDGEWKKYWGGWKPSIHMPRWASRLTLTVTDVRVQRLQEISEADAKAEGVRRFGPDWTIEKNNGHAAGSKTAAGCFRLLWNSIHGPDTWDANPWVVALTFDVHRCNIDQMECPND